MAQQSNLKLFGRQAELGRYRGVCCQLKSRKFYKGEQNLYYNPPACNQLLNFGLSWPG